MSDKLLQYIDGQNKIQTTLQRRLEHEKKRTQTYIVEANRFMQNYQSLLQASKLPNKQLSSGDLEKVNCE